MYYLKAIKLEEGCLGFFLSEQIIVLHIEADCGKEETSQVSF